MGNNMIEYKESFMAKIKNFFKNLSKRNKEQKTYISDTSSLEKEDAKFFKDIKVDTSDIDKYMEKKNFLEYIDGNEDALKMLSVDRLRKLKEYYDGVIEKNDNIIQQLKKSS